MGDHEADRPGDPRRVRLDRARGGQLPRPDSGVRVQEGGGARQGLRRRRVLGHPRRLQRTRREARPPADIGDRDVSDVKLWIRSHADLPLKVYQIVPVFRYETKMTRSFMRVREIHFFEAHTAHATFEDAEQQIHEDLQMNERVMRMLALPYIVSRRPDWDKFPGAAYSLGTDTLLPSGRAAQVATFHQYRDNFAKVEAVTYETESGEHKYVHQTTDGMS